jgi:hypothetical protein
MSAGDTTVEHIDAVDVFARNLYLRLRQCPSSNSDPPLDDVALAVRQLHLALLHLRAEAADNDSPLNRPDSTALYARQLESLIEDCGFQLRQLDTALATIDIYEGSSSDARADRLGNLRVKIANERTSIDMFLDTIQLGNPADQPAGIVDGSQTGLENIKDKVDAIANRLFSQRAGDANTTGLPNEEDRLWQEFKSELEKEGFSPQVLRRHKVCLSLLKYCVCLQMAVCGAHYIVSLSTMMTVCVRRVTLSPPRPAAPVRWTSLVPASLPPPNAKSS